MTTAPILHIRGLRRTFEAELAPVRALRGLDLDVHTGEFVAVMGPSGCGKSTLLNLIAGLDEPDGGEILIDGEAISGLDADARARMRRHQIGIVFQFFNLLDDLTTVENVMTAAMIAGASRRAAKAQADDLLDLLGLGDKAAQDPALLSGGQRQRLAIARALANEPTLLLADEPTGALDSDGSREIVELFRRLHVSEGQTILMVTHSADVAGGATRRVTMSDGRITDDRDTSLPAGDRDAGGGVPIEADAGRRSEIRG